MSVYDLKQSFQKLLRPLTQKLATFGVTANQVTVAACVMSLLVGLTIAFFPTAKWPFLLLPLFLLIRMALNAIDGMLAKEHQMQSSLGTFLNELGDVFSDTFLYLPFALVPHISPTLISFFVVLSIISEMAGIIAVQIGKERRYDGPMGKSDRAFVMSLLSLAIGFGVNPTGWMNICLSIISLLVIVTIIKRVRNALKEPQ